MRFLVDAPPYNHQSGGVRVMHRLIKLLRDAGYNAEPLQQYHGPIQAGPQDIVIYADYHGHDDPCHAANKVYYVLRYLRENWGMISSNEMCLYFVEQYHHAAQSHCAVPVPQDARLTIACVEPGLFKPLDKTIDAVYYIGKGQLGYNPKHLPPGAVEITRTLPATRREVADMLGHAKRFYCFDHFTVMTDEAHMCGCEVIYLHNDEPPRHWPYTPNMIEDDGRDGEAVAAQAKRMLAFFNL